MQLLELLDNVDIVDLSSDVTRHTAGPFETNVEVLDAVPGAAFFCEEVLPNICPEAVGTLTPDAFPGGAFLRHERVSASVHAGSHVDAPGHYGPPLDDDVKGAVNGADIGLFIGPGYHIDASAGTDPVAVEDIEAALDVQPDLTGWIVLIETGGQRGISADAVICLLERGVRVIGTDSASFDGPFGPMIARYLQTRDADTLWPTHMLGRERPYYQLERLANLSQLPRKNFLVVAPPVLIEGATAAWTRAFALVPG